MTNEEESLEIEGLLDEPGAADESDRQATRQLLEASAKQEVGTSVDSLEWNVEKARSASPADLQDGSSERTRQLPVVDGLGVVIRNPSLVATSAPIAVVVWGLGVAGAGLSGAVTAVGAGLAVLAVLLSLPGAYGSVGAVLREEGSAFTGYRDGLNEATGSIPGTVSGLGIYAVGAALVTTRFGTAASNSAAFGVLVLLTLVIVASFVGTLQFVDVRTALGDGSVGEALDWSLGTTLDGHVSAVYSVGRTLAIAAWLWLPIGWVTGAGSPGVVVAGGYLLVSLVLAAVFVSWHVLAYELGRARRGELDSYHF